MAKEQDRSVSIVVKHLLLAAIEKSKSEDSSHE